MDVGEGIDLGPKRLDSGHEVLEILGPQVIVLVAGAAIRRMTCRGIDLGLWNSEGREEGMRRVPESVGRADAFQQRSSSVSPSFFRGGSQISSPCSSRQVAIPVRYQTASLAGLGPLTVSCKWLVLLLEGWWS